MNHLIFTWVPNISLEQRKLQSTKFYPLDAMLEWEWVLAVVVCLSVTHRYCIRTVKRRITQTTPRDSPRTLMF